MLVLSRRKNEAVLIPDLGLTIKVLAIQGNQVRLGFDAPEFVEIFRQELLEASPDEATPQQLEISLTA